MKHTRNCRIAHIPKNGTLLCGFHRGGPWECLKHPDVPPVICKRCWSAYAKRLGPDCWITTIRGTDGRWGLSPIYWSVNQVSTNSGTSNSTFTYDLQTNTWAA